MYNRTLKAAAFEEIENKTKTNKKQELKGDDIERITTRNSLEEKETSSISRSIGVVRAEQFVSEHAQCAVLIIQCAVRPPTAPCCECGSSIERADTGAFCPTHNSSLPIKWCIHCHFKGYSQSSHCQSCCQRMPIDPW